MINFSGFSGKGKGTHELELVLLLFCIIEFEKSRGLHRSKEAFATVNPMGCQKVSVVRCSEGVLRNGEPKRFKRSYGCSP